MRRQTHKEISCIFSVEKDNRVITSDSTREWSFEPLGMDVTEIILRQLDSRDFRSFMLTCKEWRRLGIKFFDFTSDYKNVPIILRVVSFGHTESFRFLLTTPNINLDVCHNAIVRCASRNCRSGIIDLLLNDKRSKSLDSQTKQHLYEGDKKIFYQFLMCEHYTFANDCRFIQPFVMEHHKYKTELDQLLSKKGLMWDLIWIYACAPIDLFFKVLEKKALETIQSDWGYLLEGIRDKDDTKSFLRILSLMKEKNVKYLQSSLEAIAQWEPKWSRLAKKNVPHVYENPPTV
eukprot:TRINITY_DN3781_c0_g1_i1.p1 TRINITY_DN3781_c0_g1~~TRINITY_DN3781_c0_g1_i1.p1  ORF type:complete len:290 (+),score=33.94 TRINITY_DN3781_c0_g1_i1:71-940(+)